MRRKQLRSRDSACIGRCPSKLLFTNAEMRHVATAHAATTPSSCSSMRRRALLHVLPLAAVMQPGGRAIAEPPPTLPGMRLQITDPFFGRLKAHYILLRPGETTFEAAGIVDSNPINKGVSERGLTSKGREQVRKSVEAMKARGISDPVVFFDSGARASQTADIVASELLISRNRMEPEFRWLEARGLGALDGAEISQASAQIRSLDELDISNGAEPSEDGTPADSVNDVFSRMRNTIAKIENTYGAGDFIIIPGVTAWPVVLCSCLAVSAPAVSAPAVG